MHTYMCTFFIEDSAFVTLCQTKFGCMSGVTLITAVSRIGESGSNPGIVCCCHFHTNAFWKA